MSDLDLIDLPGIVAGSISGEPPDIMEQTRKLSEKYVKEPHTLIVLVTSNRSERVRNSQAFELVQRYNKEKQTGVLTMVDRCADDRKPEDPFWELKERLDGSSGDLPELGGGYIALKNRDSSFNMATIQEANVEEVEWFGKHLPEFSETSRPCVGIGDLLSQLLSMLQAYTEETWSVLEHGRLVMEKNEVFASLTSCGDVYAFDLSTLLSSQLFAKARVSARSMSMFQKVQSAVKDCVQPLVKDAFTQRPPHTNVKWFQKFPVIAGTVARVRAGETGFKPTLRVSSVNLHFT